MDRSAGQLARPDRAPLAARLAVLAATPPETATDPLGGTSPGSSQGGSPPAPAARAATGNRRLAVLRVAVLLALVAPVLARGGYLPTSRALFSVLAAAALLAALSCDAEATHRIARTPVFVVLVALSGVGALSAAWTIVRAGETLRWATLVGGYAALAIAAAVLVSVSGSVRLLALGLAALATVVGVVGIYGAATFTEPFADRIGDSWRAGGTLEYPPALGLLEVSALPVLLVSVTRAPRSAVAVGAAGAAAVAGASLALTASRAQPFLAACLLGAAIVWPQRTVRAPRRLVAAAAALVVGGAAAARAVGGESEATHATASAGRVVALMLIPVLAAVAWAAVVRFPALSPNHRRSRPLRTASAGALVLVGLSVAVAAFSPSLQELTTRFDHGRIALWEAGVRAAGERPLSGSGADSFFAASERHQETSLARFAHSLPLELAVELGVAGLGLSLALYAAAGRAVWAARASPAGWLLGPAVAAFLITNLIDWPWHMAGPGAVWAATLGGLLGARTLPSTATRDGAPIAGVGARSAGRIGVKAKYDPEEPLPLDREQ